MSLSHGDRFLLSRLRVDAGNTLSPERPSDDQFALQPARPDGVAVACVFGGAIIVLDVFAPRNPLSRTNCSLLGRRYCFPRFFHRKKYPVGVVRRFATAGEMTFNHEDFTQRRKANQDRKAFFKKFLRSLFSWRLCVK